MDAEALNLIDNSLAPAEPHVFRLAQAIHEEPQAAPISVSNSVDRVSSEMQEIEPSFSMHRSVTGLPFTATLYKLDKVFNHMDVLEKARVEKVDSYIRRKLLENQYEDSAEAAISIIRQLETDAHVDPLHTPFAKIEKISKFIDALTTYRQRDDIKALMTGQRNRDEKGRFL